MLRVHFRLHFSCYGMRSVMLQINEYDDDDDDEGKTNQFLVPKFLITLLAKLLQEAQLPQRDRAMRYVS